MGTPMLFFTSNKPTCSQQLSADKSSKYRDAYCTVLYSRLMLAYSALLWYTI